MQRALIRFGFFFFNMKPPCPWERERERERGLFALHRQIQQCLQVMPSLCKVGNAHHFAKPSLAFEYVGEIPYLFWRCRMKGWRRC
jgi:hypothetical protein